MLSGRIENPRGYPRLRYVLRLTLAAKYIRYCRRCLPHISMTPLRTLRGALKSPAGRGAM